MRADRRRPVAGTGSRGLALFLTVPLLVLAAVSIGTVAFSERLARSNALAGAQAGAVRLTEYLVAPVLKDALDGVPGRWGDLDLRIQNRLKDGSITAVIVWQPPRHVLYASNLGEVGRDLPATPQLTAAARGKLVSDVDDEPMPAHPAARGGPLLEVYVPLRIGERSMTVATFFSYEGIQRETALLRGRILPVAIGGLVVLQLIQVPIGVALFRRVRRHDAGRADLLVRSLSASERERRGIAADVHDGPVQDLSGVAYALAALRPSVPVHEQSSLDSLGAAVRDVVAWLRRLMTELYPPDLAPAGLASAIADLATSARSADVDVTLDVEPVADVTSEMAAVLFRTAKQALAEASTGPGHHRVWVWYGPVTFGNEPAVRLQIGHDGGGAAADESVAPAGRADWTASMRAQVADLGGTLLVVPRPGGGRVVAAVIPCGS